MNRLVPAFRETAETGSGRGTAAIGAAIAPRLRAGDVVHLHGDLGAGKTQFVKGLALGLGLDPDRVRSPTFAFVDVHPAPAAGGLGLVHVDLYRLGDPSEAAELGLDELPGPGAVAAIEWPELGPEGRAPSLRVTITDLGGDRRRIEMEWGPRPGGVGESSMGA